MPPLPYAKQPLGDLYRALGQCEAARDAHQKALRIAERLALSEPDLADYQVDLVNSLVNMGLALEPNETSTLARALSILQDLNAAGKLSPGEFREIEYLQYHLQSNPETF